jgi:hypothetical protein
MARIRIDDLPVADNLTPEQEALIQGAGLRSFRPTLESLERREVPAGISPLIGTGLDLTGGVLTIQGTHNADRAEVSIVGKANNPDLHQVRVEYNNFRHDFEVGQIQRIVFQGFEPNKDVFANLTTDFEGGRLSIQDNSSAFPSSSSSTPRAAFERGSIRLDEGGVLRLQGDADLSDGSVKMVGGQVQAEINGIKKTYAVGEVKMIQFLSRNHGDQFVNHTEIPYQRILD